MRLGPGQHVEFTLPAAANAITVRYSVPDAPTGGGITAPLDVTVKRTDRYRMTLVKDLYGITNVHFRDIRVDGTGTSVVSARMAGSATFQNVDARNVGAVGVNNCGTFHFTPAGSEFSLTDLGGNDGGGTTGPWLAPWELPNTITCDDRPPVVVPPPPSTW